MWISSVGYDPDISKLKKIISDGKGGYNLVWRYRVFIEILKIKIWKSLIKFIKFKIKR